MCVGIHRQALVSLACLARSWLLLLGLPPPCVSIAAAATAALQHVTCCILPPALLAQGISDVLMCVAGRKHPLNWLARRFCVGTLALSLRCLSRKV